MLDIDAPPCSPAGIRGRLNSGHVHFTQRPPPQFGISHSGSTDQNTLQLVSYDMPRLRVVLLRIEEGDEPDKPIILEAGAVSLEAEMPQQAACRRVAGAAFSRPVFLHLVPDHDFQAADSKEGGAATAAAHAAAASSAAADGAQRSGNGDSCGGGNGDAAVAAEDSSQAAAAGDGGPQLARCVMTISLHQGQLYFVEVFADPQGSLQSGGLVAHGMTIPPLADDELAGSWFSSYTKDFLHSDEYQFDMSRAHGCCSYVVCFPANNQLWGCSAFRPEFSSVDCHRQRWLTRRDC